MDRSSFCWARQERSYFPHAVPALARAAPSAVHSASLLTAPASHLDSTPVHCSISAHSSHLAFLPVLLEFLQSVLAFKITQHRYLICRQNHHYNKTIHLKDICYILRKMLLCTDSFFVDFTLEHQKKMLAYYNSMWLPQCRKSNTSSWKLCHSDSQ